MLPVRSPRTTRLPSRLATSPHRRRPSSYGMPSAPIGTWHPPPSASRRVRSAVTAVNESGSFNASTSCLVWASSVLVMMARAPWPGAGSQAVRSSHSLTRRASPSRVSPAPAKMMASNCPSSSFRSLVSTLPRIVRGVTSCRNAPNMATRRSELVPTTAPSFSESSVVAIPSGPTRTSRGSTRLGVAAIHKPSGNRVGRSFREWTARSTRSLRSASSSSRVKRPLPPIS